MRPPLIDDVPTDAVAVEGYSIVALIGHGGMGTVFRAVQESLGRPVAIKLLGPGLRTDERFRARFQREGSIQATLQHSNIVPVFESGESEGVPYIVMRLVQGPSLRELIRANALLPLRGVELLTGIAAALDFAHEQSVLHRDVKPHNILIERDEHAWLADFGLTRLLDDSSLTSASGIVGTYDYLAPEVARGELPSPASDVYSLAVTTFQTLTGSLPFETAHHAASLLAHASAPRPRATELEPALPPALNRVLQRGMAVEPGERQPSAGGLMGDVREAFGLERRGSGPARTRATASRSESPSWAATVTSRKPQSGRSAGARRRRTRLAAIVALVALAVATVVVIAMAGSAPAPAHVRTYPETVGGEAHTWSNYLSAGGRPGPLIPAYTAVGIRCKLHGFRVQDGDTWWYRIESAPWNGRYYVSADAFYNDGQTRGTLLRTPFVDPKIPDC